MQAFMAKLLKGFGSKQDRAPEEAAAARTKEKAIDEFMVAARSHDVSKVQELLDTRQVSMDDEVGRGRGLLQFAVMVNSIKTVSFLRKQGANPNTKDSLGATSLQLAKSYSDSMKHAVRGMAA